MELSHFKDMGDTESVVTNAVVLVLGVSNFNGNVPLCPTKWRTEEAVKSPNRPSIDSHSCI